MTVAAARDVLLSLAGLTTAVLVIVGALAAVVRWQIKSILMKPNGGNSIADVSSKVDKVEAVLIEVDRRLTRVEDRQDNILIPRQHAIQRKLGAANRDEDR